MALSRLRLRLTGAFALAFAVGLTVLVAVALGYLWLESVRRLDSRLHAVALGVVSALEREARETPDSALAYAAAETVAEWPANDDSFVILDENGAVIAAADRVGAIDAATAAYRSSRSGKVIRFVRRDQDFRAVASPAAMLSNGARTWKYQVMAYQSTEAIEHDVATLLGVVALVAPLLVVLSLGGGYILARRALEPMSDLRASIASVAPSTLQRRIPLTHPRDEIGVVAAEFNALLDRLSDAQRQNRQFIRAAAHQIRTPLTLVLGEAGHELGVEGSNSERMRMALARIRTAAEQMTHRVDDLFLLAEAQAGEDVRLGDDVELDGLILECTDLMRGRATGLGRTLAIGHASPVQVRGNVALLREALMELIENGLKHGDAGTPITVSCQERADRAVVSVESAGPPFALPRPDLQTASGIGLPIVEWIVKGHHATIGVSHADGRNVVEISLPLHQPA